MVTPTATVGSRRVCGVAAAEGISAGAEGADGHVAVSINLPALTGLDLPKQPGPVLGLPIGGQLP